MAEQRFQGRTHLNFASADSGAPAALMDLGRRFKAIGDQNIEKYKKHRVEEEFAKGQQAGIELEKGKQPSFMDEDRFIGGVTAKAYNKGLASAYVIGQKDDYLNGLQDISNQAGDSTAKFDALASAQITGVMEGADPLIAPQLHEFMAVRSGNARRAVQNLESESNRRTSIAAISEHITRTADASAQAALGGDVEGSALLQQDANSAIDSAVESDLIDESLAPQMKRNIELSTAEEFATGKILGKVKAGNTIEALEDIQRLVENPITGYSLEEKDNLTNSLIASLNQALTMNNKIDAIGDTEADNNQDALSQSLYGGILTGTTTQKQITTAVLRGDINEAQATRLTNTINRQGVGVDDWNLIAHVRQGIQDGENVANLRQTIENSTGSTLTNATASQLVEELNTSLEEGSLANTSQYRQASKYLKSMLGKISGPLGSLDEESDRRVAIANRALFDRAMAGESPLVVVDQMVAEYQATDNVVLKYGFTDEPQAALVLLKEQFTAGNVDDDTFNSEHRKIENLIRMESAFTSYEAYKKAAKL
jgi:hypothetical protein